MQPNPATHVVQARANAWANTLLYAELEKLRPEQLSKSFGVNFGSILGIANHAVMADSAWLQRFTGVGPPVRPADYAAATDFPALRAARLAEDERIVCFAEALAPARLLDMLHYANLKGEPRTKPFAICLAHFYNHQTFHRGQLHALLGVLGFSPPDLDLIFSPAAQHGSAS